MKTLFSLGAVVCLFALAACQSTPTTGIPTPQPFPTMTAGQVMRGTLGDDTRRSAINAASNPATVAAIANQATPTPNTSACPVDDTSARLPADEPTTRGAAIEALLRFLNVGGTEDALRDGLQAWDALSDGAVRAVDLTADNTAELVIAYRAPGDVGTLAIFGCEAGRYVQRYQVTADGLTPPEIIWVDEMTARAPTELVFASRRCADPDACEFSTQIIQWEPRERRFVNLLDEALLTLTLPQVRDVDDDGIIEVVVNLESNGTSATGPLRTGVNIYDWNGAVYTLSIVQLNAPRYHVQVLHEADKLFLRLEMPEAIELYEFVLDDENNLRYWFNDGPVSIDSYAYYRLLLAYAHEGNPEAIQEVALRMVDAFPPEDTPLEERPVYVHLATRFVDELNITSDLHQACDEVRRIIEERPEALDLLNRYGSRSPRYDTLDICPF